LVSILDQLRHQDAFQGAADACNEHPHRWAALIDSCDLPCSKSESALSADSMCTLCVDPDPPPSPAWELERILEQRVTVSGPTRHISALSEFLSTTPQQCEVN
jgi:hypothetical protein